MKVQYIGLMKLSSIGNLVAERRRAQGMTLSQLAAAANVGRSTLAALEAGKLPELGIVKVARLCAAVGLVLEARPTTLDQPLIEHRHLTEEAGRDLTKAAIADVIERGDVRAWRGLVRALRESRGKGLASRVSEVLGGMDAQDARIRAFAALLPAILASAQTRRPDREREG